VLTKCFFTISLLITSTLFAGRVDIVSSFTLDELVPRNKIAKETGLKVRVFRYDLDPYYRNFYKDYIDKILIMANIGDGEALAQIPFHKRILFLWEPHEDRTPDLEDKFYRIYTFNDDIVDNQKYFKFAYPVLVQMKENIPSFDAKKFCVMMTHRFTKERAQLIRFFETKAYEEFEYYGFNSIIETSRYRGQIPGHPVCDEKLEILKNFRFCICFENTMINGYITEKIFTCFTAGCVPVYQGAPNVESYIPKECFIDYRDFKSDEEMYNFLKSMSKERYEQYLSAIERYLSSEQAKIFSKEHFSEIVAECVNVNEGK